MRFNDVSPEKMTARTRDREDLLGTYGFALKQLGLRPTTPRLQILDVFHQSVKRHLTAEEVFRALLAKSSEIGLATVYRTLSQFEDAGLLRRNAFDSSRAYFELNDNASHHHLRCLGCGTVHEFSNAFIDSVLHELARTSGYELVLPEVAIQGYCAPCARARKGDSIIRISAADATS